MKIMKMRKKRGITQTELAKACGTTQQQIAKLEKGLVDPKLSTLRRVAEALHCDLADLFWSRKEFLKTIEKVVKDQNIDLNHIELMELNNLCLQHAQVDPFHPYWENLIIENNKITLKEKQS